MVRRLQRAGIAAFDEQAAESEEVGPAERGDALALAEEAMPAGGRLTITGYLRQQERVAVVEVSDTGMGVPAGVDVFQLFMTTKPGASGLGLPTAAQIIASHGGCLQQLTERTPGTTFEILLPLPYGNS